MSLNGSGDGNRELIDSRMIKQENEDGVNEKSPNQSNQAQDTTALTPKSNASGEREGVVVKKEETQEPDYIQSYQPLPKEEGFKVPGIKYEDDEGFSPVPKVLIQVWYSYKYYQE
ncbi:unnamed protein product, partial [Mesorhabditis belari]|uniref:Uncharacterized protein n=1 Tax=Mesorhabditis belari TaxID=2138241 RepID=A0AAF3EE83_9BILA